VPNKTYGVTKTHSLKRFEAQPAKSAAEKLVLSALRFGPDGLTSETYPLRYVEHFWADATKKLEGRNLNDSGTLPDLDGPCFAGI